MKKVLICSGKGGVGKTTVTTSLAKKLRDYGFSVGILDVDIDTPNVPEFMNITDTGVELSDEGIKPKIVDDIEVMSIGLIADNTLAIMWDGERRAMAIDQMINKVEWSCDVLLIDSPPGTTDEVKTVIKKFDPDGIIIITTNHRASISDVKRTLSMIKLLESKRKIIGIVKNMTYILCEHCGEKTTLFESGKDEEIDSLVIDEVPYVSDISNYIKNTADKVSEMV